MGSQGQNLNWNCLNLDLIPLDIWKHSNHLEEYKNHLNLFPNVSKLEFVKVAKYDPEVSYYKTDGGQSNLGKAADYPLIMGTQYDPYCYIEGQALLSFKGSVAIQELFSCLKHQETSNSVWNIRDLLL